MSSIGNAEYVIVGGGAVGCGVAYSLAKAGRTDVLVVERAADVGQVTTAQGAGLCGQVRDTIDRTRLAMHSVATFRELQKDPDVRPEWNEVGSLRIALTDRQAEQFRKLEAVAKQAGLEAGLISLAEAKRRWPPMDFTGVTAVLWCPSDGSMTPYRVAKAYEHQCRKMGVRFATGTAVDGIDVREGRVRGVRTDRGAVECRYVINAAGAHAYHVAKLVGLELPIVPVRHEYYVTVDLPGLTPDLPCFRVPERTLYGRVADGGGLLLGGWERQALETDPRGYEIDQPAPTLKPDGEVLDDFEAKFAPLFPQGVGRPRRRVGIGWPTFTPDGHFIIGESRRVPGFVMAGGCNAHGISGSAGIGRLLVQSLEKDPPAYVRGLSPDRFTETAWDWADARRQARQVYEAYYGTEG